MFKNFLKLSLVFVIALSSCNKDDGNAPQIKFDKESVTGVFAGDEISVTGKVTADNNLADVFWFHQKLNDGGTLDETTSGTLSLSADGSFSLPLVVTKNTIGVKISATDNKGKNNVKVLPIVLGDDALVIAFEGTGTLATVNSGEDINVKGTVTSGTPITGLSYSVMRGQNVSSAVNINHSGENSAVFDFTVSAAVGMTGIRINASNRGTLTAEKIFIIQNVVASGPVILFDKANINVKPDSAFIVSGQVTSDNPVSSLSYVVYKDGGSEPAKTASLDGNKKFSIEITANLNITGVELTVKDSQDKVGNDLIPVTVLYPSRTEGSFMIHYKNLIFDDRRTFEKSYFSFDVAPYVLNKEQAKNNETKVDLMFTNVFIATGNANNGAALFGSNAADASTIMAQALLEDWTLSGDANGTGRDRLLARLPVQSASVLTNNLGTSNFDEIGDSQENCTLTKNWLSTLSSSNSVLRTGITSSTVPVGTIFAILYNGKNVPNAETPNNTINKYAIGIVLGKGGLPATEEGQSTGSWLEVEIKVFK